MWRSWLEKRAVSSVAATALSLFGCGEPPCSEGSKQAEPAGLYAEIGLPEGGAFCEADPQPFLNFVEVSEDEAIARFSKQMKSKGWDSVPLTERAARMQFEDALAGRGPTYLLFAKEGTTDRRYAMVQTPVTGKRVLVRVYSVECPDGQRNSIQSDWCPSKSNAPGRAARDATPTATASASPSATPTEPVPSAEPSASAATSAAADSAAPATAPPAKAQPASPPSKPPAPKPPAPPPPKPPKPSGDIY